MNIEELGRRALDDIKKLVTLPEKGTLAGGSLANLIWEYVSGNKAIINDIDIFVHTKISEEQHLANKITGPSNGKKAFYKDTETTFYDTYNGLGINSAIKDAYYINKVEYDGLLNTIHYESTNSSPQIVIDSFDINCTRIAYSIDQDKFYWGDDFVSFLETGYLKLSNLSSPCHSAIRLCKKKEDLNAKLDSIEIRMCQYVLHRRFPDVNRRYFTTKYLEVFKKYAKVLIKYFRIQKESSMVPFMRNRNPDLPEDFELFTLTVYTESEDYDNPTFGFKMNADYFFDTKEFLFYVNNISEEDKKAMKYWDSLRPIYTRVDYIDYDATEEQIEILKNLSKTSSGFISNMKGLKLSEQCRILDRILEKCDKTTAIRILNRCKITPEQKLDDDDIFLMSMLCRKDINKDISHKVKKVFGESNDENVWTPF